MKKHLPIYLYGAIIIFAGVFLLFSTGNSFDSLRVTIGISLTIGAVFSLISAFSNRNNQVAFSYHEMHALAMMVYGVSILVFGDTFEKVASFTAFLLFFYTFSEITFCSWLFNLGQKVIFKIIAVRLVLGLLTGVGTILVMQNSLVNQSFTLAGFGILFMMVGINIMLYVPAIKKDLLPDKDQELTKAELEQDILQITMKIHTEFPELAKYIAEIPENVSGNTTNVLDTRSFQEYYHSLEEILEKYAQTHRTQQQDPAQVH